jgi:hypothetical protein
MFPHDANRAERLSQRVQRLTLVVLLLLSANVARAHDFWIEASTFHPWPGQFVMVGLRVGQDFVGEPVRRYSPDIAAFFVRQNGADIAIEGADGITPAGILRAAGQATEVIGYASTGTAIELPPDQFEDYLRLYGLEAALADRIERGEHLKPGRERFYRYAKTLLAGQKTTASASKALGLAYEIVPDDDPTARLMPFRGHILYDGKPLAGALVEALLHGESSTRLKAYSDAQGAFSFALPRAGVWLIKSVHMVRAPYFSSEDWDSRWASLVFEAPAAPLAH